MSAELIYYVAVGFLAGVAVRHFWKQIKQWVDRMLGLILDSINIAIEVTSDPLVELVKKGFRQIYKQIVVYVKNIYTGEIRPEYREELIPHSQIPDEIKAQLEQKARLKLTQQQLKI
ncbi:hypothetical protein WA1_20030 [Scytonema hofmannii PCC 7110]|uniref:Uncharacterized protein n=1 Tax=Scytonema hofmannii PCC 7110 TaxID=128403 RepID=A0A139XC48_9CYAN|nr:hypothetical protein [Scytonema hofmannii]KYC42269.1 hypothetical protein WA1_20030 [Scytonema hofmannii PCC 7110]